MAGGGLLGLGLERSPGAGGMRHFFPVANEIGAPGLYQRLVHQAVIFSGCYIGSAPRCMAFSWGLVGTYTGFMVRGSRPVSYITVDTVEGVG